jgi:3-dehydroquinate synthetase
MGVTGPGETCIRVSLSQNREYDVVVGDSLLGSLGERLRTLMPGARKAALVFDDNLPDRTVERTVRSIQDAGIAAATLSLHASESRKTLETHAQILNWLASERVERNDIVVALGGGIVGDIGGYAAASYRRGIPVVQCPTTLLAMVDASVGGKTGVNLVVPMSGGDSRLLKNMAGAFWQPRLVLADVGTLDSLEERQFRSGLAECIKHAMLAGDDDPDLLEFTRVSCTGVSGRVPETETLIELVSRNVQIKARVVEQDERETASSETGGRAVLNLGHTFAHAIETAPGAHPAAMPERTPLLHGEAVALGLIAAVSLSVAIGRRPASAIDEIRHIADAVGLPVRCAGIPSDDDLMDVMRQDKKSLGGEWRFVVPIGPRRCAVVENPPVESVLDALHAIREEP